MMPITIIAPFQIKHQKYSVHKMAPFLFIYDRITLNCPGYNIQHLLLFQPVLGVLGVNSAAGNIIELNNCSRDTISTTHACTYIYTHTHIYISLAQHLLRIQCTECFFKQVNRHWWYVSKHDIDLLRNSTKQQTRCSKNRFDKIRFH